MEFLEKGLTIPEVNRLVRQSLGKDRADLEGNADFLFRTHGIFWYRGMVIAIDVNHPSNRRNGISRALLIKAENGLEKLYKVNDNGELQEVTYQEGLSDEYKRGFIKH